MKYPLSRQMMSAEQSAAQVPGAKANWILLVLGLGGFALSLDALLMHLKASVDGQALACDINETFSCSKVFGSSYGEFLGIPLGAFGMAYFGIVMAVAVLPKMVDVSEKWISHWRLVVSGIGIAASLQLFYISYFVLHAVCPVCTAIHVINLLVFGLSLYGFFKNRKTILFAHPNAFLKLVSTSLALATPPLLAGVLGPSIAPMIFKKNAPVVTDSSGKPVAKPTIAPELLTVAKNNFVGKGEDYRKGNDDAKVVMHMWSDFECPACRMASGAIDAALAEYGKDKVLFVYRNYPLSSDCNPSIQRQMHPHACDLAEAARCAGAQGKFWEFKEWAFKIQDLSEGDKAKNYSRDSIAAQASALGLDATRFKQCLDSDVELAKIKDDVAVGDKVGIPGTPTIVINGQKFQGDWRQPETFINAWEQYSK